MISNKPQFRTADLQLINSAIAFKQRFCVRIHVTSQHKTFFYKLFSTTFLFSQKKKFQTFFMQLIHANRFCNESLYIYQRSELPYRPHNMFPCIENNYDNFQFVYQVSLNKHEDSQGKLTKIRLKYKHIINMHFTFMYNLFISYEYVIKLKYMILNMSQFIKADY